MEKKEMREMLETDTRKFSFRSTAETLVERMEEKFGTHLDWMRRNRG